MTTDRFWLVHSGTVALDLHVVADRLQAARHRLVELYAYPASGTKEGST